MTDTTATCVRGCHTRNRHATNCPDRDKCRGCLPRTAKHGLLCYPCHARMRQWFDEIAGVPRNVTVKPGADSVVMILPPGGTCWWLSQNMATGTGAAPEADLVSGSRESLLPIKAAAFDVRELLIAQMADLVDNLREVHGLTAPRTRGVREDAKFLRTWQGTLERHDWVRDWWDALAETMSQAHAVAPWRASMTWCHGIACPECGETNLVHYGGDEDVTCGTCRTMIPPARYGLWVRMLAEEVSA